MSTKVKNSEAITTLKCLRELLLGSLYLEDHYKIYEERTAMQLVMARNISQYIYVLDLYLTDSAESRSLTLESAKALELLLGGSWTVMLSDGESLLLLSAPSKGDLQSVKASFPANPKNAKAYHRWQQINTEESQPTAFGPPDENGKETRF